MKTPEQLRAENEHFPTPIRQVFNFLDRVIPPQQPRVIIRPMMTVRTKRALTADGLIPKSPVTSKS